MKSLIQSALIVAAVAAPIVSFAQSNAPLTPARVKADLARLEKAGYLPTGSDIDYPANLQAAEARLALQGDSDKAPTRCGGTVPNSSESSVR
ncbi:hypothetical protein PTE30175_05176 [Pandoraea terrae]|uniref:Purine nucleoside phosphorylase n=1 Tax=Pandoraea terrae TaxID=1537710 RepID=A0A5E4ZBR6_9BURK|nr:DUF4148 domain-containing protein [Pandoraea terrae]VVE58052.1 hypothetical protein PTE30175_05176 [Pandoraea terrae]